MKLIFLLIILFTNTVALAQQNLPLNLLHLPPGFKISIYAVVPNARQMTLGSNGTLFVGSRDAGKVYAIIPDAKSPYGTRALTIASDLNMPNGVAFKDGSLYVAAVNRILRFDDIENHLNNPPTPVVVTSAFPSASHHGWRYIQFGPDNKLYIGVGAPCNACLSKDSRYATIMRMNADGSNLEIYTQGVRNTVGFDWDPLTKKLWFTDNGRDWLGDDLPPDEINYAPKPGLNFGYPYCFGKDVAIPVDGKLYSCEKYTPATFDLPAHVAPLGLTFYTGKMFPNGYSNQMFIAEHGSWNRSSKVGYQVIIVKLNDDRTQVKSVKTFINGWLQGQSAWGRPVDTLVMPDGSLLISDDTANVIYRVSWAN
jgi:glucose/arabinose dehydrogenase